MTTARLPVRISTVSHVMACTVQLEFFRKPTSLRAFRNRLQIDLRCPEADRLDGNIFPSPWFRSVASKFQKCAGSLAQAGALWSLAVRHENRAIVPIQIFDAHPKEFALVPHPSLAHQRRVLGPARAPSAI